MIKKWILAVIMGMLHTIYGAAQENEVNALIKAAGDGNVLQVCILLNKGFLIDSCNKKGDTALIKAADKGNLHVITSLLKRNANINAQAFDGYTALMRAVQRTYPMVIKKLLDAKALVNMSCNKGETALIRAIKRHREDIVNQLLVAQADVNMSEKGGDTPLMCAVDECAESAVELLLYAGAQVNASNKEGATALNKVMVFDGTASMCMPAQESIARKLVLAGASVACLSSVDKKERSEKYQERERRMRRVIALAQREVIVCDALYELLVQEVPSTQESNCALENDAVQVAQVLSKVAFRLPLPLVVTRVIHDYLLVPGSRQEIAQKIKERNKELAV